MPRSFLVKKVRLDDLSSADHEGSYVRSRAADLSLRFHDRGYISDYLTPSGSHGDSDHGDHGVKVPSPTAIYAGLRSEYGAPDSPASETSSGYVRGGEEEAELRDGYGLDAFLVADGRSRRRQGVLVGSGLRGAVVDGGLARSGARRHACGQCGKSYATSSNLSRHRQTHRSVDGQMAKRCPTCGKVYVSMPAMTMHLLTHDLKHKCEVCGKAFSRPWLLQGHMRSHTGEKPFGCSRCGKTFADRSNLRAHVHTHATFKHYKCKRCSKTFALKSYLNKHYESACSQGSFSPPGTRGN